MTTIILYTLGSVLIVSLAALVGIVALSLHESFLRRCTFFLVSVAVGALFGSALIHLLPGAFSRFANPVHASAFVLAGILVLFVLEKFLHWHHGHGLEDTHDDPNEAAAHHGGIRPVGRMVIIADGFHNLLDGIIIAGSYFISIEAGIATTTAVLLHEIPQEISDFGVLIHAGYTKSRALLVNFASALTAVIGAGIVLFFGHSAESLIPAIVAFTGGFFLYIAGADLVPELQRTQDPSRSAIQFVGVLIGIGAMFGLLALEENSGTHASAGAIAQSAHEVQHHDSVH